MRLAITGVAVVVLIVIGFATKAIFVSAPSAEAEIVTGTVSKGISVYDLHVQHPDMKSMTVQEVPLP